MTTINASEDGYLKGYVKKWSHKFSYAKSHYNKSADDKYIFFDFEYVSLPVAPKPDRISKNMMAKISSNIRQPTVHWTYSVLCVFLLSTM
jgi:hypothetical protein